MQTIFITADDLLIAVHTSEVPPLDAYPSAAECHQVEDSAIVTVLAPAGFPRRELAENWRDLIVVPEEAADA